MGHESMQPAWLREVYELRARKGIDRQGRLLAKIPLPASDAPRQSLRYREAWLGGDRWVVTRSPLGVAAPSDPVATIAEDTVDTIGPIDRLVAIYPRRDGINIVNNYKYHYFFHAYATGSMEVELHSLSLNYDF